MPRITITIADQTPQPYRFGLDRQTVTFGRGEECDITVNCGSVSIEHAVMKRVPGGYKLQDLGSTNGIKLNGNYQQVIDLENGQSILLGDVAFDFVLNAEELMELESELDNSWKLPSLKKPSPPVVSHEIAPLPVEQPEPVYQEAVAPQPVLPAQATGQSGVNSLAAVLAFVAFLIGMSVNYQNDTGEALLKAVVEHISGAEAPADSKAPADSESDDTEP